MATTRVHTTIAMKRKLTKAFRQHLGVDRLTATQLVDSAKLQDKAYELTALIAMMTELRQFRPSLKFVLEQGAAVVFRAKGGPIQRSQWPYVRIEDVGGTVGEIWVDIECIAVSAGSGAKSLPSPLYGKCHELDIVLVRAGTSGRPLPTEILLGVEAKHRPFNKALLKELLGVRREMTMRTDSKREPAPLWFVWWADELPANPPSGLVAYCSSPTINQYSDPADFWGIKMSYLPFA